MACTIATWWVSTTRSAIRLPVRATRERRGNTDADNRPSRTAIRIGIPAVICATIAVTVATVMLLMRQPAPAEEVDTPVGTPTPASAAPTITTPAVFEAPSEVTATAIVDPQSPLPAEPTAPSTVPESPAPPSPTIRAPISIEPEPHPPFPNQFPSQGENQPGGLLPGLPGLPGPLG